MSNLIHNERVKYAATFFNSLGVVSFATGVILPTLSLDPYVRAWAPLLFVAGIFLGLAFMFSATYMLGSLKE